MTHVSHPMHKIKSHRIEITGGQAKLISLDIEDLEATIAFAYIDEEEYNYLLSLAGRLDGMLVGEAQDAWHRTCVALIQRSVR